MNSYIIDAATPAALMDLLEDAQAGKVRPFVVPSFAGRVLDPARCTEPQPIWRDEGTPYALLDPETEEPVLDLETDEPVMIQPRVIDHWTSEIRTDEPDAELAAIAA